MLEGAVRHSPSLASRPSLQGASLASTALVKRDTRSAVWFTLRVHGLNVVPI